MIADILALLAFPCIAAFIFVGMHTWLGLHVLRRRVIFADLALAQLSALGATVAVAIGHMPGSTGGFAYALLFTLAGAVMLTLSRRVSRDISQEPVIGIVYVVATALTVLVIDRSPQGAEHVKRMLVGSILTIGSADVLKLALLYGAVGLLHALCRRPMLAAAVDGDPDAGWRLTFWDFVFYATFGLVVTSSVTLAGVLLVFSFLIIPAVIGTLYSRQIGVALGIGWVAGVLASLLGFGASLLLDVPTGAAMVAAFAVVLVAAMLGRVFLRSSASRFRPKHVAGVAGLMLAGAVFLESGWLMLSPRGDHPLLAAAEVLSGIGPERFLTESERSVFNDAAQTELRNRTEVDRLRAVEREARWKGKGLEEEELRRMASFQQSFNEMSQGERFVQDHLRATARARQRWYVAVPAMLVSGLYFALFIGMVRNHRRPRTLNL